MALPTYMKKDGDKLIYTGDGEIIYYVPEKYFNTNNAEIEGEYVNVFGLFNYDVFDKSGKNRGLKIFMYLSMIKCKPTSMTKETALTLKGTSTEAAYRLLHFSKGSELICSTKTPQSVLNAERFMNLLFRANIPENLSYERLQFMLPENAAINGFKYGLTQQMFGLLMSEICRDPSDLSRPYRYTDMKQPYKAIPITQIPKFVSAYTSITSENADEAIANAIMNKSHKDSPLEKVIMN